MRQIPIEVQNAACEMYAGGMNAKTVAARLGVSKPAVLGALRRRSVAVRKAKCLNPTPVPEATRAAILDAYVAGENATAAGRRFGVSQSTVFNILTRGGVASRSLEETTRNPNHRHDVFSVIDTDAKAWALGLLAADGNVASRSNNITLSLKAEDADAVEKLRDIVCPTAPVTRRLCRESRTGKMVEYAVLVWASKQAAADLARHGVTPAKSKTLLPWDGPSHLMPAYFRGLLDGDGSWVRYVRRGRGTPTRSVSLTGTEEVCRAFRQFVGDLTGNLPAVSRSRSAWVCMVSSKTAVVALASILYAGETTSMDRKRRCAEAFAAEISDPAAPYRRFPPTQA